MPLRLSGISRFDIRYPLSSMKSGTQTMNIVRMTHMMYMRTPSTGVE